MKVETLSLVKPETLQLETLQRVARRCRMAKRVAIMAVLLALGVSLPASRAQAADGNPNDLCFGCHSEKTMATKHGGRTVSLYVDGKKFASSVHGSLACTNCHADLEGVDLPHPTPKKVQCGTCHATEQEEHAKSLHGKALPAAIHLAPRCVNCHGNHDILP